MMGAYYFNYSKKFKDMILEMHRGKENMPDYKNYITDHLGGKKSRLSHLIKYLIPEIKFYCGNLKSKKILDFGCGTGTTTVALAMNYDNVTAFDIDKKSIKICVKRLEEHGLKEKVKIVSASDLGEVAKKMGNFDFILLNAVLEHIPLSKKGLRRKLLRMLFDMLNPGGCLYITETPNRICPIDTHTTGLWWIPWAKPGSKWAYSKAIKKGRHLENPSSHSRGPLGLEECGAWGATFFEIRKNLSGKKFQVVNSLPGHNKHLNYTSKKLFWSVLNLKINSRIFDFVIFYLFSKWTKIPLTALAPSITNLVIRKIE